MIDYYDLDIADLFDMDFDRISINEHLNMVNKPYTINYINRMLYHYQCTEEYEKCIIINNYSNNRFPHGLLWKLN